MTSARLGILGITFFAGCWAGSAEAAQAQSRISLQIASQDLGSALNEFARQSGTQLMFTPAMVAGRKAAALKGSYTSGQALQRLLSGSGLTYRTTTAGAFILVAQPTRAPVPTPPPPPVRQPSSAVGGVSPTNPGPETAEIVVTAQRRSESLQRVPITITAFTGETLAQKGVDNTADLQLRTPGLLMSANVVFGQPYLRGIGNSTLTIGSDSSVAVHLDGVYLARPMSSFQEFFDVERVEVLKGPQGTLYGRNATGGVINIISADPTDEISARAEVQVGNYERRRIAGTLSGPLSPGLNGRLTILKSNRDGYVRNLHDGSRLEDEDIFAARAMVQADPTESLRLTLSADLFREDDTRGHGLKSVIRGAGSAGYEVPPEPHDVRKDYPSQTKVRAGGAALRGELELGDYLVTSLTGYRHSEFDLSLDLDLSDRPHSNVDPETENSDSWSQELQITSPRSGPIEWIGGLFYFHERADTLFNINLLQAGINQRPNGFNTTDAYAIFGQGSLWATSQLRLTAGGRYSHERKKGRVITNFPAPTQTDSGTADWGAFTPRFSIDFFPSERVMLYASATRGFKSGGFNATARGLPRFDPEYVWSYEGGIKSTLADGRVRANLSAFHYDYRDLQVRALVSGVISTVTNAAKATVDGAEAELMFNPIRPLTIDVGLAYLNARFKDFITTNPDISATQPVDLADNRLPRAPRWTANFGAQYDVDLVTAGMLSLRGDFQYQSRTFFDEFNDPTRSQPGFSTIAARATWTSPNDRWSVALWGRNLTDKNYVTNSLRSAGTYGTALHYGPPRTYGLTVGVKY